MSFVNFFPKKFLWEKAYGGTFRRNPSLQIKTSSIHENMQINLEKLHAQIFFGKFHNIFPLCWFFYYVNYNKEMDGKVS
jgi:hypothetical protein